jgi:hypothetical protein
MSQSDKSFTVRDRRHFTPDGRSREELEAAAPGSPTSPSAAPAAPGPPVNHPAADFSEFLLGLAAQARVLLSGEGVPEGIGRTEALGGVRSVISILEMLEDKTRGRRTEGEEALLDGLLFDLRMAYVERAKAGER